MREGRCTVGCCRAPPRASALRRPRRTSAAAAARTDRGARLARGLRLDSRGPVRRRRGRSCAAGLSAGAASKRARRSRSWRCGGRSSSIPTSRRLDARARARRGHARSPPPSAWTRARAATAPKRGSISPAAHAPLVQWRVLRDERLAAARDGKTIKDALERALALDPDTARCLFRHRAVPLLRRRRAGGAEGPALAAAAAGRRPRAGTARDAAARATRGELLRGEADYQLHWLYLWYEEHRIAALALLRGSTRAIRRTALPAAHRRSAARVLQRSRGERCDAGDCCSIAPRRRTIARRG